MIRHRPMMAAMSLLVAGLLATACADTATLTEAADKLAPAASLGESETEILNGFETITREYRFYPDISQREACDLGRQALEEWAGRELNEAPTTDYRVCSYDIRTPTAHGDIVDYAAVRVGRAKVNGEFVSDQDAPGGVAEVVIFFNVDK